MAELLPGFFQLQSLASDASKAGTEGPEKIQLAGRFQRHQAGLDEIWRSEWCDDSWPIDSMVGLSLATVMSIPVCILILTHLSAPITETC